MKTSGIDWIGEIPCSWNIKRIKYLAQLKGRIGWQGLTSDEYTDVGPFLITGVDFSDGSINWESCVHITEERWAEAPEIHIKNGDLLITKDGTVGKVAIVENLQGKASLNSGVLLIKASDGYNKKFLYWVLLSEEFWTWFRLKNAGNSTIIHLYQNDFAEFSYTFPDITEQNAIADFLDKECAQIDSINADLEKQIELLQQYKKSLITETVTKGLDKSVPMKDSGVEWTSKIPCHWEIKRFKYLCEYITDGSHFSPETADEGYPYITAADVKGVGLDYDAAKKISQQDFISLQKAGCQPRKGDVLLVKDGATTGRIGMVTSEKPCVVLSSVAILRAPDNMDARYLRYLMESDFVQAQIQASMAGSAMPRTVLSKIINYWGITCPKEEQKEICDFLDRKCGYIETVIETKQVQQSIIQQHKKSLIYEYVTGKKRVKEVR